MTHHSPAAGPVPASSAERTNPAPSSDALPMRHVLSSVLARTCSSPTYLSRAACVWKAPRRRLAARKKTRRIRRAARGSTSTQLMPHRFLGVVQADECSADAVTAPRTAHHNRGAALSAMDGGILASADTASSAPRTVELAAVTATSCDASEAASLFAERMGGGELAALPPPCRRRAVSSLPL